MTKQRTQNIWAVGRNYAAHAKEMHAPVPKTPLFFLKSGGCLNSGSSIELPKWSQDVHHELEIAFLVDENLNFSHLTLAIDLTARDHQEAAKKAGQPWTLAKSFAGACPIGSWISILDAGDLTLLNFKLTKNKITVQEGVATDMIFNPSQLLEFVKNHFPLSPNDIILTGTPEGVGKVVSGDMLQAELYSEKQSLLACHWDVI
ncbi:MAG: fumarylacetoacetate hydrolase family protein [Bdellovibrio sp.]|nr:fumarylacetoacetate hydrolase family protein [Bdellovibrio sp.]